MTFYESLTHRFKASFRWLFAFRLGFEYTVPKKDKYLPINIVSLYPKNNPFLPR